MATHIETVEQKLKRLIGILYKIRYKLPDWCLRNIYFALVHHYMAWRCMAILLLHTYRQTDHTE